MFTEIIRDEEQAPHCWLLFSSKILHLRIFLGLVQVCAEGSISAQVQQFDECEDELVAAPNEKCQLHGRWLA